MVVGRLENCDVVMEHPSLSRHHAVVQYKADPEADKEEVGGTGFYLFDLGWVNFNSLISKFAAIYNEVASSDRHTEATTTRSEFSRRSTTGYGWATQSSLREARGCSS